MSFNDKTLEDFKNALEDAEKSGYVTEISKCYNKIAIIHQKTGNYDKALDFSSRALEMSEKVQDTSEMLKSYHQIAIVHQKRGDYDKALDFSYKTLGLAEKSVTLPVYRRAITR